MELSQYKHESIHFGYLKSKMKNKKNKANTIKYSSRERFTVKTK